MKTRIKIIERRDGTKKYICQKKGLEDELEFKIGLYIPILGWVFLFTKLFWEDMDEYDGNHSDINTAKERIDAYISAIKHQSILDNNNKINSTTYLKYP